MRERRKLAELEKEDSFEMSEQEEEELSEGDDDDDVEEKREEHESVFLVGNFVWGKIKNHPWWPGQIYDESHASDLALKHKPKDKNSYLVAYFGDGTFSWCSGSQLKSFDENFQSLSRQSSSESFLFAVEDALSVLGELAAQEMGCSCVRINGQVAGNAGIRKGVLVPMVGVDRLTAARFDSAAVIARIKNAAQLVSVENRLELSMLNSKLLAFYRLKGYKELPKYCFPVYIDGLEDISKRGALEDGLVSNEDKLYERRKRKSLTESIKEEMDTDVQNDKDDKETPPSRRKRVGQSQTDLSEKGGATKGRNRAARTSVLKDGADKSRDGKRKKDYFTPIGSVRQLGFEPVVLNLHNDTRVGERMSKAAKLIIESPPIRKQCHIVFEKEPAQECIIKDGERLVHSDQSMKQGHDVIDPMPEEMLSGLKPASFTPLHERPFGSKLDVFSLNKLSNNETLMNDDNDDDNEGRPLSAILLMTFSPGVPLPSKAELLTKYREFGLLNEEETEVLPNSLCAQVGFIKKSEAEQAVDYMVKMNSADSGVQYCIRYIQHGSKFRKLNESVHPKTSPQSSKLNNDSSRPLSINYLKQKLETLISKLSNVEGEALSNDLKNELHSDMSSLLAKLN